MKGNRSYCKVDYHDLWTSFHSTYAEGGVGGRVMNWLSEGESVKMTNLLCTNWYVRAYDMHTPY